MEINSRDCVTCSACGYEIAAVIVEGCNERALRVHDMIKLTIIDKEKRTGLVQCPKCGAETPTNLDFWRKF
jgi:hypothetical protein